MGQPRRTRLVLKSLRRHSPYESVGGDHGRLRRRQQQQQPISKTSERLFVLQVSNRMRIVVYCKVYDKEEKEEEKWLRGEELGRKTYGYYMT